MPDDPVNPAHYQGDYVMRIIEDFKLGFCLGNTVKYILRAGRKPDAATVIDLRKALWYLQREIGTYEKAPPAQTFFLNEQHELPRSSKKVKQ